MQATMYSRRRQCQERRTMFKSAVQCSRAPYNVQERRTMFKSAVQCSRVPYSVQECRTVFKSAVLCLRSAVLCLRLVPPSHLDTADQLLLPVLKTTASRRMPSAQLSPSRLSSAEPPRLHNDPDPQSLCLYSSRAFQRLDSKQAVQSCLRPESAISSPTCSARISPPSISGRDHETNASKRWKQRDGESPEDRYPRTQSSDMQ
jgi:hypothetical protein